MMLSSDALTWGPFKFLRGHSRLNHMNSSKESVSGICRLVYSAGPAGVADDLRFPAPLH